MSKPRYNPRNKETYSSSPPQEQFGKMVNLFWENKPYIKDVYKSHELEIRFGTRGIKPLTKIDYDNVIHKLKSLGFRCPNEQGVYMLRIQSEFLDVTGNVRTESNIRTEINGFHGVQEYCKHNDLKKLISESFTSSSAHTVEFYKKEAYKNGEERLFPVNFDDFNFRVSYQTEDRLNKKSGIVKGILDKWEKTKKSFRYINRVTFIHPDFPVKVDISITKSSQWDATTRKNTMAYTTTESGVFSKPEVYEIELEVDNTAIGPGTSTNTHEVLLSSLRKVIKYVLMGLQGTNYPISYPEQREMMSNYMKLIMGAEFNAEKHGRVKTSNFIGPSPYTLQINNIVAINPDSNIPNIRSDYTVTDKADGERFLVYISNTGRIYMISSNMNVLFTGALTENKEVFNTLIDGEIVHHDKNGKYINLYLAFDIYYFNKTDVRGFAFVPKKAEDIPTKYRLPLLKNVFKNLNAKSVLGGDEDSPMRFECKRFYPTNPADNIFASCNFILAREAEGLFEYITDGLIFTPASLGVGSSKLGSAGPLKKIAWEYAFKWKPPQYNTIDFLVKTVKSQNGADETTPIFQDGMNTEALSQLSEYKTVILCVGYDPNQHGYLNPCQDVLDDKLPHFKNNDDENTYKPAEFVPTNPTDVGAGIANILLKRDDTGTNQMFTEEGEVFRDDTIVEFRYEMSAVKKWQWIPLRMRYDKTARYKQGFNEFGNAYNVANSNWHSIHHPITSDMIRSGENIPDEVVDEDVYYNRVVSSTKTRGLRDFHNLFVKRKLITCVSRKEDTLIDYACGKGGDFPKWIDAQLSFVFGVDVAKDNLENRMDGACARFMNYRKDYKSIPYALFVNGNSGANRRSGVAMMNDKAVKITRAVFGDGAKSDALGLGKAVERQYGKGENGFNVSSCQFALHYFFESRSTFQNFIRNVSECTKVGGYFIGTCYDGKSIFNLLRNKGVGESIELYDDGSKVWEIRKEYEDDNATFQDNISSLGHQISVYQESINKTFPEFLVNFDYLERVMEDYGFKLATRDEAKDLGLPEGSGLFSELFNVMTEEIRRNRNKRNEYGTALEMTSMEKKISFLNRYFVYKKLRNVNAEKVVLDDEGVEEGRVVVSKKKATPVIASTTEKKTATTKKSGVKKISRKLLLVESLPDAPAPAPAAAPAPATATATAPAADVEEPSITLNPAKKIATTKATRVKKVKLVLE